MQFIVEPGGEVRCLYEEDIDLAALGMVFITRASHVEPDEGGGWWANLKTVNGPILGPFAVRSDALRSEKDWLIDHWLNRIS